MAQMQQISTDKACPGKSMLDPQPVNDPLLTSKLLVAGPYVCIAKTMCNSGHLLMFFQSQAIKAGNTLYISGQLPATKTGELIEGTIGEKTAACIANLRAIAEAAGSSLEQIVKCTVFLTDMANFADMNAEYEKHFSHRPSRSCVAVKQLPKGVPVEIEAVAMV